MIKALGERWTLRLIIITPLVSLAIFTVVITSFYIDKMRLHFNANTEQFLKEYIDFEKREGEAYVNDIETLVEFTEENLERRVKDVLDVRMDLAYRTANYIYDKYHNRISTKALKSRIQDALYNMRWQNSQNYVWITDYEGNNILSHSPELMKKNIIDLEDADGRAIILEEIQVARKYGEGYIKTRFREGASEQLLKVVDFKHFNWYFGTGVHYDQVVKEQKNSILELIAKAPGSDSSYLLIYEGNSTVYTSENSHIKLSSTLLQKLSSKMSKNGWLVLPQESSHLYLHHFEPYNWTIVYGLKKDHFKEVVERERQKLENIFNKEVEFIILASLIIAFLVGVLTFIVSRRIIVIIQEYREELDTRELELRELNSSLELRVDEAIRSKREKEKMLIQQSKMAAMGDMISMIAHQWRQPLNQMSYVLMNIESSYEYKEMTPQYMDEKVKEGTKLLEYMSHTIDDFKNFFRPDKEQTKENVSEVIENSIALIKKSFDAHKIEVVVAYQSQRSMMLYRNELIQVLLNLLSNAKDAVVMAEVANPLIHIVLREQVGGLIIEVCDNATGVSVDIIDKIFEPYFSTKSEKNGTGLGLYMTKTIVEEHLNGKIFVENREQGACFTVLLKD